MYKTYVEYLLGLKPVTCQTPFRELSVDTRMATRSAIVLAKISFILFVWRPDYGSAVWQLQPVFSDKTSYHFVEKPLVKPPQCVAVHVNMVIRHGSRYPGTHRIGKMKQVLDKINELFSNNSTFIYKGLSLPWIMPADMESSASKELSKLGSEEMYSIAQRLRDTFAGVLGHGYSNTNYSFVTTDKLRCSQSAMAFAQGLFEGRGFLGPAKIQPVALTFSGSYDDDKILRIFEACPKWQKLTTKRNPRGEYARFLNGQEMRKVGKNVFTRLNFPHDTSPNMVAELFWLCAFGAQTNSFDTSWCSVFEEKDLKVLEYLNDLKIYWERSYGRKINYRMSCPLYQEIAGSIEKFLDVGKPHGIFRFAHTGTIVPLFTMLGLYNDSLPLRADNYKRHANRTFRVSDIVPMSGNVAFVLYDCSSRRAINGSGKGRVCQKCGGGKKDATFPGANMKVQLLVNEAAVSMPACGGEMYCSVEQFLSYYSHIKDNCDFDAVCSTRRKKKNRKPTD